MSWEFCTYRRIIKDINHSANSYTYVSHCMLGTVLQLTFSEFYVSLTAHPCTISQISPTRCTILLNVFISLLYTFWASMCPSSGENYCICAALVLALCIGGVWSAGWIENQAADRTPPIQSDKYQCHIDTVIFSWQWAHGCQKHVEKINKYIKQNCAPSWTYLQDYTGRQGQQNIKFRYCLYHSLSLTPFLSHKNTCHTSTHWLSSTHWNVNLSSSLYFPSFKLNLLPKLFMHF